MSEYLAKFVARCGAAARRKAVMLVKAGAVEVNGRVVTDPAFLVDAPSDIITLNNQQLHLPEDKVYIMLNKPRGYTTSHSDRHAQHLAYELIDCPEAGRLVSAGRLDKDSEGLLIFSNDGDFIHHLEHPRYDVHKQYLVTASIELDENARQRMLRGIKDAGETLKALQVTPVAGRKNCYLFELNEGKKREIRRLLKANGAETLQLQRIAIGPVKLGTLAPGQWRKLTTAETTSLLQAGTKTDRVH